MAIKWIVTKGFGLSPGSVKYIPTKGFQSLIVVEGRVTQGAISALHQEDPQGRATQAMLSALTAETAQGRMTADVISVLWRARIGGPGAGHIFTDVTEPE